MKIGIIGSGKIGGAIGTHWARNGHEVFFINSRISDELKNLAKSAGENARVGTIAEAAEEA